MLEAVREHWAAMFLWLGVALILWWWRPLPLEAPGKYGALAMIPLVLLAFWAATRRAGESRSAEAPLAERAG